MTLYSVIGAGVAGLAAIGTAQSLGAIVRAFDVRPEVAEQIESMGALVTAQFATMGGYDFVNIIEAPTNEVMARLTVELGSRGTIKITTLPAMGVDEFVEMLGADSSSGS